MPRLKCQFNYTKMTGENINDTSQETRLRPIHIDQAFEPQHPEGIEAHLLDHPSHPHSPHQLHEPLKKELMARGLTSMALP